MAGGTHVMPRLGPTESIISLRHAGLSGIEDGDEVRIGATTTLAEVGRRVAVPALRDRVDRLAHDPQPGDGRRQPVRARSRTATSRSACSRSTRPSSTSGDLVTGVSFKVPGALVLHEGDAPQAELGVDRHGGLRRRADRARRRRAGAGARARGRGGARERRHRGRRASSPSRPPTRSTTRSPAPGTAAASFPSTSAGPLPMPSSVIELELNGEPREFLAAPGTTLLCALRETLGLTAAKRGCAQGTCGTCTCHVDGAAVMSCLVPVETINGSTVHDARGHDAGRRPVAAPAGVPGRLRHPVRLLHAGDDHGRRGAAGREPEPDPRGRRARDLRQRLPLHGLREHHQRDPRRGGR